MKIWIYLLAAGALLGWTDGRGQEFIGPHGYLTLEAEISNKDAAGRRGTFDLHHFNIFGDYLLNARARVFSEIEFEHGTDLHTEESSDGNSGGIRLERAWFEYEFFSALKIRLGKFLTPYGIYNEIHDAAPAYDTSTLPNSVYGYHVNPFGRQQRFFAKFAIGAHVLGKFESDHVALQYHFLLSNGRGENPFQADDNANKALGLRLLGEHKKSGLKLGASLYSDRNGLAANTRQTAVGLDAQWQWKKFQWAGELSRFALENPVAALPGQVALAGYVEAGVQIYPRQTVLVRYDVFDPESRNVDDSERDLTVGTNFRFSSQTVIKMELHFWSFAHALQPSFRTAVASLAVVF